MLTLDDYIQLLEDPTSIDESAIQPLRDMLTYAPYCSSARLMLLRALFSNGRRRECAAELQRTVLYAPMDVSVYFLLREPVSKVAVTTSRDVQRESREHSLSYFDMLDKIAATAKRTGLSFEELTQRYISTRKYTGRDTKKNNR